MKLILHYMKRYKWLVLLNILSVFGFALVELGIPTMVSNMIDEGVLRQDKGYLLQSGAVIAVISLIGVCGTILLGYCCAKISTAVTRDIRNDVFAKVQSFSHAEMNRFGVSSLITRTNNDAFQILTFMNVILRTALLTPVMIVVSFALTISSSLDLSLIIASTVPIIVIGVVAVGKASTCIFTPGAVTSRDTLVYESKKLSKMLRRGLVFSMRMTTSKSAGSTSATPLRWGNSTVWYKSAVA